MERKIDRTHNGALLCRWWRLSFSSANERFCRARYTERRARPASNEWTWRCTRIRSSTTFSITRIRRIQREHDFSNDFSDTRSGNSIETSIRIIDSLDFILLRIFPIVFSLETLRYSERFDSCACHEASSNILLANRTQGEKKMRERGRVFRAARMTRLFSFNWSFVSFPPATFWRIFLADNRCFKRCLTFPSSFELDSGDYQLADNTRESISRAVALSRECVLFEG